jgi:hypothetical protein
MEMLQICKTMEELGNFSVLILSKEMMFKAVQVMIHKLCSLKTKNSYDFIETEVILVDQKVEITKTADIDNDIDTVNYSYCIFIAIIINIFIFTLKLLIRLYNGKKMY